MITDHEFRLAHTIAAMSRIAVDAQSHLRCRKPVLGAYRALASLVLRLKGIIR